MPSLPSNEIAALALQCTALTALANAEKMKIWDRALCAVTREGDRLMLLPWMDWLLS